MDIALDLAREQAGRTGDNPAVGCVIVKAGKIIGYGATADGGRPHGEVMALQSCTEDPKGARVYVTLEPCSHYGRSGPCADALVKAEISECIIAARDPNPQVDGQGIAKLEAAGILARTGDGEAQAAAVMADFFARF